MNVNRLGLSDLHAYRALRLLGLQMHPESFGSSFEEEDALPDSAFAERLTNGAVFGRIAGENAGKKASAAG